MTTRIVQRGFLALGRQLLVPMPAPVLMIVAAVALGLLAGGEPGQLPTRFGQNFGKAMSDFSLIIIPSFVMAACLAAAPARPSMGRLAAGLSPACAAGMVCPDTAYSALAAASGRSRLHAAFGSYAGFKLLAPAGPLIVATGLGVSTSTEVLLAAAMVAVPVLAAGWLWASRRPAVCPLDQQPSEPVGGIGRMLAPFATLAAALSLGATIARDMPLFALLTTPQGALMAAAVVAWLTTPAAQRRSCLERAMQRSASLLLLIGAAAALGSELVTLLSPARLISGLPTGVWAAAAAFALAAVVKSVQGSSMVTFATVTPLLAPLVAASGLSPAAAVLSVCLGSFAALLPNDSFYWLVRTDALAEQDEWTALRTLAGGSLLQALTGLGVLLLAVKAGWL